MPPAGHALWAEVGGGPAGRWLVGFSLPSLVCVSGDPLVVIGEISWLVALSLLLRYLLVRLNLASGSHSMCPSGRTSTVVGGLARSLRPVQRTPLWSASWLAVVDKSWGSKSVEVQRVWEAVG